MVAVTLIITSFACFFVGFLIADRLSDKRFWDRQDYMEKLNKKF